MNEKTRSDNIVRLAICCLLFLPYLIAVAILSAHNAAICHGIMPTSSFDPATQIYFGTTGFGPDLSNPILYTDPKCEAIFAKCSSNCRAANSAGRTFNQSMFVVGICSLSMAILGCLFSCWVVFYIETSLGAFAGLFGCLLGVAYIVSLISVTIAFGMFNTHTPCTDSCLVGAKTNTFVIVAMVFGWVLPCCCCMAVSCAANTDDSNQYRQLGNGSRHGVNVGPPNSDDGTYKPATANVRRRLAGALRRTNPSGQTAFYDATVLGLTRMIAFRMNGRAPGHKFIQIVLTDGEDSRSKTAFRDVCDIMEQLRDLESDCRTIFIGVSTTDTVNQRLQQLKNVGGNNVEFYMVTNMEIESIFERIELSIGIRREVLAVQTNQGLLVAGQERDQLNARVNFFAVQFLLDISGSMRDEKWSRVCNSVDTFMSHLTEHDLVSCVIFNDNAEFLSY